MVPSSDAITFAPAFGAPFVVNNGQTLRQSSLVQESRASVAAFGLAVMKKYSGRPRSSARKLTCVSDCAIMTIAVLSAKAGIASSAVRAAIIVICVFIGLIPLRGIAAHRH